MLTANITTEMVDNLYNAIEANSLAVLKTLVPNNIRLRMNWHSSVLERRTETLDFSTRARNSLMNAHAYTIGDIVHLIETGEFYKIRSAGSKTRNEITSTLLVECYYSLSEKEKKEFCKAVYELNFSDPVAA